MSTGIKYYPESSYVSISFAWIKDQRLQGWNSETHFELVILLHNWTDPAMNVRPVSAWWRRGWWTYDNTWSNESCQTFPQVPKMWMPRGKRTRSCNNGNMRHQDSEKSQSGTSVRSSNMPPPFQAENGVLSTKDGLSVVMDFWPFTLIHWFSRIEALLNESQHPLQWWFPGGYCQGNRPVYTDEVGGR